MARTRLLLILPVVALTAASAAQAHVPFTDGPKSARLLAKALNADPNYEQASCRYTRPHVVCNALAKWDDPGDTYLKVRITVHKTAPKRGFAMICSTFFGICKRQPMTFSS